MSDCVYELRVFHGDSPNYMLFKCVTEYVEFFHQDLYLVIGNVKYVNYSVIDGVCTAYIRLYKEKSISWMKSHFIKEASYAGIKVNDKKRTLIKINKQGIVSYLT